MVVRNLYIGKPVVIKGRNVRVKARGRSVRDYRRTGPTCLGAMFVLQASEDFHRRVCPLLTLVTRFNNAFTNSS